MANWSHIHLTNLPALRLDPEYYQPDYLALAEQLATANPLAISDFADVTDGIHDSPDWVDGEGVICLSAKCVKDNEIVLDVAGQISQFQNAANPRTQARLDDVLISSVGTIGNAAVVDESVLPANTDRHLGIIRIRDKQTVDPYYLSTFLNCRYGRFQSLRESTGNVQLNLFIDKIKQLRVPVGPSFNEVSQLTRQAYALRQESKRLYGEAEQMLLDALGLQDLDLSDDICSVGTLFEVWQVNSLGSDYFRKKYRELTHALTRSAQQKQFVLTNIGKIASSLKYGTSEKLDYLDSGVPFLRITDLVGHFFEPDSLVYIVPDVVPSLGAATVNKGDVIISRTGTLGVAVAIPQWLEGSVFGSYFIRCRFNQRVIDPAYLAIFLNSKLGRLQVERINTGAIQTNLTIPAIESLQIIIPSLELQQQIITAVENSVQTKQSAKELLRKATQKVEALIAPMR